MLKDYTAVAAETDGSELTVPTATRVIQIATREDANLVIVCAYGGGSRRAGAKMPLTETAPSRIKQIPGREAVTLTVTRAKDIIVVAGVCVKTTLLVEADPAEVLLSSSRQRLGDLIAIGAICDRSIVGHLLGDVASTIVRRAHCDMLAIRPVSLDEDEQIRPESDA